MKRYILVGFAIVFCLYITACSSDKGNAPVESEQSSSNSQVAPSSSPAPTSTPKESELQSSNIEESNTSSVTSIPSDATTSKSNLEQNSIHLKSKSDSGISEDSSSQSSQTASSTPELSDDKFEDVLFQTGGYSLKISPQHINNTDNLANLLPGSFPANANIRYLQDIQFSIDMADSVMVYDYILDTDEPVLLFEKTLDKMQNNEYVYKVLHSSDSLNNPYGYNEVETRGYVFILTFANESYAYSFVLYHDGSHA